jgi:hypothetical protein
VLGVELGASVGNKLGLLIGEVLSDSGRSSESYWVSLTEYHWASRSVSELRPAVGDWLDVAIGEVLGAVQGGALGPKLGSALGEELEREIK